MRPPGTRGTVRRLLPLLLAAAFAILTLTTGFASGAASAEPTAGPKLTVTPATDLATDDVVTVTGTGFARSTRLFVMETVTLPRTGVPVAHTGRKAVTTDRTGSFTAKITVKQRFAAVDCAETRCFVTAVTAAPHALLNPGQRASAPISFQGEPTLTVVPQRDLQRGDEVTVTGTGFARGSRLHVAQTVARPANGRPALHREPVTVTADAAGKFTAHVTVAPMIKDVKCLEVGCFIAAYPVEPTPANRTNDAWTPISFDPSDRTTVEIEHPKIEQAETARIKITGAQPGDRYAVAVEGPGEFSAQPFVTADKDGNATILMMSNFDQEIGDYTVRLTTDRTGNETTTSFTVGTSAFTNPAQESGEEIANPQLLPGEWPTAAEPPPSKSLWSSPWTLGIGIAGILFLCVLGWFARDRPARR
ncbi:neocarzinostatin apoprotein domain-containing protein [Gordonia iterans]